MTSHLSKQQLSQTILNTVIFVFTFWQIGIYNCMKVTFEEKKPSIGRKIIRGMDNSIRVERGIYTTSDKRTKPNESSNIYFSQNWSHVQTINDTATQSDMLSLDEHFQFENLTAVDNDSLSTIKDVLLPPNPREPRNVNETIDTKNLCHLCDCKTGDNGYCNINSMNISNSYKSKSHIKGK